MNNSCRETTFLVFPYIIAIYITALILRPILAFKMTTIFGFNIPSSILIFPLSFICNDIFSEVYGYKRSRAIVNAGLFVQILASLTVYFAVFMPSAHFWQHQNEFELVLGQNLKLTIASLLGCYFGEIVNSIQMSKLKYLQKGAIGIFQMRRFVVSTVFGELVDSLIFFTLAFSAIYSTKQLVTLIITSWTMKVIYEIIFLPLSMKITEKVKLIEGIDIIDDPRITSYGVLR